MRALTGYPLWFGLISAGLKFEENRDRSLVRPKDFGVPFAIHHGASQAPKEHAETWAKIRQLASDLIEGWQLEDEATWPVWYRLSRVTKAVVAVATIECRAFISRQTLDSEDCLFDVDTAERICPVSQRRFAFGPVVYMLRDVRRLPIPVPCRGKQGFWTLPADVAGAVIVQLGAVA